MTVGEPDVAEPTTLLVVVVTYNSGHVIRDCLRSIDAHVGGERHVVVADNDSSDDTLEQVRDAMPSAIALARSVNDGYSAAINAGIAAAPKADAVLVLNPDVRLRAATVERLWRVASARGGVAVPQLLQADGRRALSIRREPTAGRAWAEAILGGGLAGRLGWGETVTRRRTYERLHTIDWSTGAVMLLTADCLAAVGPFDESFFLYSEETDYMLRVRDAGLPVTYVPEALAVHIGGELSRSAELWSRRTINRVRLQRRRHGRVSTASFLGASLAGESVRAVAGRQTSRRAAVDLLRAGPRIIAAGPPPLEPAHTPRRVDSMASLSSASRIGVPR
jgi:GT2 family glycosyltransferase